MRANQIREITRTQIPRRINKFLNRNSQADKRKFFSYLNTHIKKGISSKKGKQKREKSLSQDKLNKEGVKNENSLNGKGQFIDIRV